MQAKKLLKKPVVFSLQNYVRLKALRLLEENTKIFPGICFGSSEMLIDRIAPIVQSIRQIVEEEITS